MLKRAISKLSMLISIVSSVRSGRVVSSGGLHLSVAYDLTSFMTYVGNIHIVGLFQICCRHVLGML